MAKQPAVYILASQKYGTLYTGVTGDIRARVWQHRSHLIEGFTQRYGVERLVYFEFFADFPSAIKREKQIKKWNRRWKIRIIEENNPDWVDLWSQIAIE